MQIFNGAAALSEFRRERLLAGLQQINEQITAVNAQYVHLVSANSKLTKREEAELQELLAYGEAFSPDVAGELFVVAPRPGTISPWSSKATDIVNNCGIDAVERVERAVAYYIQSKAKIPRDAVADVLHDRMTEAVFSSVDETAVLFEHAKPAPLTHISLTGRSVLKQLDALLGRPLDDDEIDYLIQEYKALDRDPTDVELMMFAVVNSEHCRHKIFNADWVVDGKAQPKSLFKMIKNTYEQAGDNVLSAYSDNAAVIQGAKAERFFAGRQRVYEYNPEPIHLVIKVETHNHPTAIAPHPGSGTGVGGEIRDEGATGRGAKPKMGLTGFSVSNLHIPGQEQPWEKEYGKPDRLASSLDIMLEGPIGAAGYANEYGRVNLAGYFRTYEQIHKREVRGYHKPIMIGGGVGNIREQHIQKLPLKPGGKLIVLGGPAMQIGLGGGAASSVGSGTSDADLDFASVQRANAEIERRAQEVLDACWALGKDNPIRSIHDVGAGGLSNALPELVHDSGLGARIELRDIPNAEPSMSPLAVWCNEAQERYVLGIQPADLKRFEELCGRERCPFAVVGETTKTEQLVVTDRLFNNKPVDIPMSLLFGKPPKMTRTVKRAKVKLNKLNLAKVTIEDAAERVLKLPAVASKKFLITIGDRTVGGLVARDQMIGPWQVPVGDVAVTASGFTTRTGEAMAMGERAPLALINSPAAARMAVGEAITNMAAARIGKLSNIKLSANWMATAGYDDEALFDTVAAIGEAFCPALGITIPVGKDSLSMRTTWQEGGKPKAVTSPLSLVISAFAPVVDVTTTLTPELSREPDTELLLISLDAKQRLGGSALAQTYNQVGDESPDVDPTQLQLFFAAIQQLASKGALLAYHDRSDGGLFATLAEMAFASRCGVTISLDTLPGNTLEQLFNEELGAVVQVKSRNVAAVKKVAKGLQVYQIGSVAPDQTITFKTGKTAIYENTRAQLESWWSLTSYHIQRLRDNPECADEEYNAIEASGDPGLSARLTFKPSVTRHTKRPRVAILREQGVNGHVEMAAAFDRAGFTSVDVHMSDLMSGAERLDHFTGLVACGGFSYGDVLGAGEGWAKSIIFNPTLRKSFEAFFTRTNTFSLGVCNGCQALAALKDIIPGADHWPPFLRNESEQFEARLVMVQVAESPSIFFNGMTGSQLPIPVAHGEGRAGFGSSEAAQKSLADKLVPLQYVDNFGVVSERYPANPNGSPLGITSLTTPDGRATILMPHPERAFLTSQLSWYPNEWNEDSAWMQIFRNARAWVG